MMYWCGLSSGENILRVSISTNSTITCFWSEKWNYIYCACYFCSTTIWRKEFFTFAKISSSNINSYLYLLIIPCSVDGLFNKIQSFSYTAKSYSMNQQNREGKKKMKHAWTFPFGKSWWEEWKHLPNKTETTNNKHHRKKTCLEMFGAKPPSSPTLHPWAPYFSAMTACPF